MVHGLMSIVKYLIFFFNFVFVIAGIALISVGAIVHSSGLDVTAFVGSKYVTVPIILIVLGVIIFLVAFLGCCGAIRENYCMVLSFGLLLFAIFVVEMGGGIAAFLYKAHVRDFLKSGMYDSFNQGKDVQVWEDMQSNLECCGVNGPYDFVNVSKKIPKSCCSPDVQTCEIDGKGIFDEGCYEKLSKIVKKEVLLVAAVAVGVGLVELAGVIFSFCLSSAIKKDYENA